MPAELVGTAAGDTAAVANAELMEAAEKVIKEMEDLEDYYFGSDKDTQLERKAASANTTLDEILSGRAPAGRELRVQAFFLKGRAASLLSGQERKAEELLSKAIKLDPQCLKAWNTIGEVYWNLRDFAMAKQCFEKAIELCGANAVSLRNLSMVLRAMDSDKENNPDGKAERSKNYSMALEKAKEAVALDPSEPLNWETLGNAYMGEFFVNAKRPDEINRALIAYDKAEAAYEKLGKRNPTLQLNRGTAANYIEDYDLAIRSFQKAHEIGAAGATDQAAQVLELVQRLAGCVERRGDLKGKRLKELLQYFPDEGRSLAELRAGEKATVPLAARVVQILVDRKDLVPVICVCCDGAGDFFALSIYNAEMSKVADMLVPMKSFLHIEQAKFRSITVNGPKGKQWTYPSVRVAHPGDVTINGSGSLGLAAVQSVFTSGMEGAVKPTAPEQKPNEVASRERSKGPSEKGGKKSTSQDNGRAAVIKGLMAKLRVIVDKEVGQGSSKRLQRIEQMFGRIERSEVHEEDSEELGQRYSPGYVDGLTPNLPFHNPEDYTWCAELKRHWMEIRDELRKHLLNEAVWKHGAYSSSNKSYAPEWRIAGVLTENQWRDEERWKVTQGVLKSLQGVNITEAFFARMAPHTKIAAHSDNLNYILTSHLALELEPNMCTIQVGNDEREWEEGEMLVFDTSYIHACFNDSDRNRYVLVLRFWHPDLSEVERVAIHRSHEILAATPMPDAKQGPVEPPKW